MTLAQWAWLFLCASMLLGGTVWQGAREVHDAVTTQGKSITEAIDRITEAIERNTEAIKTQTNRYTSPERGSP